MMTPTVKLPTFGLATLSIILNLAILGCAAHVLATYNSQKSTNAFFLPVWNQHFDTREISALIGTSTCIFVLNLVLVAGSFLSSLFLALISTSLSTLLSLLALIFSAVINTTTPTAQTTTYHRDTLQSWTCRWSSTSHANAPSNYNTLCRETKFAFYTTIPVLLLQLLLLSLAAYGLFTARARGLSAQHGQILDRAEKGSPAASHEMGSLKYPASSVDTRLGTPKSVGDSSRYK